jgi:hypothetical protein
MMRSSLIVLQINEAFASQAVYSIEKLGLPYEKGKFEPSFFRRPPFNVIPPPQLTRSAAPLLSGMLFCLSHGEATGFCIDRLRRSHPLGATGARQVATAYAEAKRTGAKLFVTSMCIVSGREPSNLVRNCIFLTFTPLLFFRDLEWAWRLCMSLFF